MSEDLDKLEKEIAELKAVLNKKTFFKKYHKTKLELEEAKK